MMERRTGGTIFFLTCLLVMFVLPMAYAGEDRKCEKCRQSLDGKVLKHSNLPSSTKMHWRRLTHKSKRSEN